MGLNNKVIRSDVFRFIKSNKEKYNFIFADPPYDLDRIKDIPKLIFSKGILENEGILVIEHDKYTDFSDDNYFKNVRQYGRVMFSFFNFNFESLAKFFAKILLLPGMRMLSPLEIFFSVINSFQPISIKKIKVITSIF